MPFAIGLITIGLLLAISGVKGISIQELIMGEGEASDPKGGGPLDLTDVIGSAFTTATDVGADAASTAASVGGSAVSGPLAGFKGTPKQLVDNYVIPIARKNKVFVTPLSVAAANAAHSITTTSGNKSDHKGPPNVAWAADMSNGGSPTKEMDGLARDLATAFGIPWSGSGLVNHQWGRYRIQLIYRTNLGGNHYNHVHFGVKLT